MCKMIISPGVFFNFKILIFWIVRGGWKGKKWPIMTKISICCTLHFRNHVSYDLHFWNTCIYKRAISPGIFFIFLSFKMLIFRIIRWRGGVVKRQKKRPKMTKILSVSFLISVTVHCMIVICMIVVWLWYDSMFCSISQGHIIEILIMISTSVFLWFFLKNATL